MTSECKGKLLFYYYYSVSDSPFALQHSYTHIYYVNCQYSTILYAGGRPRMNL